MSSVKLLVIGGDGAKRVETGKEEIPFSVFQCSGFHLSRACSIGWENGSYIYSGIHNGDSVIPNPKELPGDKAAKARSYVLNIQLTYHGEWGPWCNRDIPKPKVEKRFLSFDLFHESDREASLPVLEGPHGRVIKDLTFPEPLLN